MSPKTRFPKSELKMPEERFGVSVMRPSHKGIIIGVLILCLVLILGGLYAWGEYIKQQQALSAIQSAAQRPTADENNEPESTNAEAEVENITTMSTSDELDAINTDLQSTVILETLDADLTAIEAELAP